MRLPARYPKSTSRTKFAKTAVATLRFITKILLEINRLGLFQLVASDKAFACGQPMPILPLCRDWCVPNPYTVQAINGFIPAVHHSPCKNYWTANLYFKARNGTFRRVPQMLNLGLSGREGITIYYIPSYDGKSTVTAFPKGFRMLVGDPGLQQKQGQQKQLCHRCFSNMQQVVMNVNVPSALRPVVNDC